MAALKYWVWLATLPGLGTRTRLQLLEHFDSPEDIYYADEGELLLIPDITKAQAALLADKSLERTEQVLADCDFIMNVTLPDVGEQHMLRVKNGVLLVYENALSDEADVSITCPKNALFAILTNNSETVAKAVKVEGNAELLTLLMENMNQFSIVGTSPFNIIEP